MPSSLPTEALAGAAIAALLLLPGLLVVRSPWTHVPLLSVAFWAVTWWWLPGRLSRGRFLWAALLFFALVAALRLLRARVEKLPPWPVVVVLVAALLRLLPCALWLEAPGVEAGLRAEATVLLLWRDGVPLSHEPFAPAPFGPSDAPGVASLAADVGLLSGLPADRAVFLAAATALALLQIALFSALGAAVRPGAACLGAVSALALPSLPQGLLGGDPAPLLSLALAAGAAGLLARPGGASSAVAAGALAGGAVVSDPWTAALGLLLVPALLPGGRVATGSRPWSRLGLAAGVAAALVVPFVVRLASVPLAPLGAAAGAAAEGPAGAGLLDRAFVACALSGLVLRAVRTPARALGGPALAALLLAFAPRSETLVLHVGAARLWSLQAVALGVGFASLAEAFLDRPGAFQRIALGALLLLGAEGAHRSFAQAASEVLVTEDDLKAAAWLRTHTGPQDVVCVDGQPAGEWIPALAGRAVRRAGGAPLLGRTAPMSASCALRYVRGAGTPEGAAFSSGSVALVRVPTAPSQRLTSPGGT